MSNVVLKAMLVCDRIYRDELTKKLVLAGTIHQIGARNAPGHYRFGAHCYLALTGLRGAHKIALQFVDMEDNQVLFRMETDFQCTDPLSLVQINVPLPTIPYRRFGYVVLEAEVDSEPVGDTRIEIRRTGPQPTEPPV